MSLRLCPTRNRVRKPVKSNRHQRAACTHQKLPFLRTRISAQKRASAAQRRCRLRIPASLPRPRAHPPFPEQIHLNVTFSPRLRQLLTRRKQEGEQGVSTQTHGNTYHTHNRAKYCVLEPAVKKTVGIYRFRNGATSATDGHKSKPDRTSYPQTNPLESLKPYKNTCRQKPGVAKMETTN